jgi:hypothetical protein
MQICKIVEHQAHIFKAMHKVMQHKMTTMWQAVLNSIEQPAQRRDDGNYFVGLAFQDPHILCFSSATSL